MTVPSSTPATSSPPLSPPSPSLTQRAQQLLPSRGPPHSARMCKMDIFAVLLSRLLVASRAQSCCHLG
jgi:hypothetical protein